MPNLYVAMYHSEHGIYEHWALYLETDKDTIYEVVGELPNFKLNVLFKHPTATKRHKRSILIYTLNDVELQGFENVLATVVPGNTGPHWNCQNYVIEVLEQLEEKGVIKKDNEAYNEARKQLQAYFGPLS
ncbi:hypothetical protein MMC07_003674 [Pseudocyphellaria aurata]|nr:hypothetical protein [Pseudocyphellaria aurata]